MGRVQFSVIAVVAMIFGCVDPAEPTIDSVAHHAASITTSQPSYTPGSPITVNWSGMPGNQQDWIAIAPAGSTDYVAIAWTYLNGQTSGSYTFGGLQAGNYEARAFQNNTYTSLGRVSFTVAASQAAVISTDKTLYTSSSQSIVVSFTNLPGNQQDWIALSDAGSSVYSARRWAYTNGVTSGSMTFAGLPAGNYEARAFRNNTYELLASSTFSVSTSKVTTNKTVYTSSEPIVASWTGMPGNQQDWIAVAAAGSADTVAIAWTYMNGQTSGSYTFGALAAGNYEVRAYLNNTYTVLARVSFTVTTATVTTNASTYVNGAPITVSWTNLPGNQQDWVALADVTAPLTVANRWAYTNGAASGSVQLAGLPPGTYEARAFANNTYTLLAKSAPFTVTASNACTTSGTPPVFGSITSGDLTLDATQAQNTVALPLPLDRTILFTSLRESEPSPNYGGVTCALHDVDMVQNLPAGITCDRANAGTDTGSGTIVVHYTAVTFSSGVTVQRGLANTNLMTPTSVTLTSVDPTQSFVLLGGTLTGGSGWGNNEFIRAQLVNGTTLDIRTTVPGTQVAWQVVTMSGASVQRGTTSLASGATQQQVAVTQAPSGSMVLASYTTDNASGIAASATMMRTTLASPTSVVFARDTGGANLDVSWEVVSLPFATYAGSTSLAVGATSANPSVSGNFTAASSVAIATTQALLGQATGSTSYAGADLDLPGEAAVTLSTGTNSVSLQRASSQASANISWTVIDFAHNCNGQ